MADIGVGESGLIFETKQSPRSTHENWVMRHLENMTMASEMRIKSETMGFDFKSYAINTGASLLEATLVSNAANFGHAMHDANIPFTLDGFNEMSKNMPGFGTFLRLTAIALYGNLKTFIKRPEVYKKTDQFKTIKGQGMPIPQVTKDKS